MSQLSQLQIHADMFENLPEWIVIFNLNIFNI